MVANVTATPTLIPEHVAIIMDGNGRWAQSRGKARTEGHQRGADSVRTVVRTCRAQGVRFLTLYAFSVANWNRPQHEVTALMFLLAQFAQQERPLLLEQGIRLNVVGDVDALPLAARAPLEETLRATEHCSEMVLSLALSYGGRRDIAAAARRLAGQVRDGLLSADDITEERLARELSTGELPPVDLLIRTSGESRLSDFLLYESAYAELLFVPTMWPDFGEPEMLSALQHFAQRERRFGLTSHQIVQPEPKARKPADSSPRQGGSSPGPRNPASARGAASSEGPARHRLGGAI